MLIYALSAGHHQLNPTGAIMYLQLTCSHTPQVIVIQIKHPRGKSLGRMLGRMVRRGVGCTNINYSSDGS